MPVPHDPLVFPATDCSTETLTLSAGEGRQEVTYRAYRHIPYVARPVDADYQSLDVDVPVAVDGIAIDASAAPILFVNGVGGYLSDGTVTDAGIPPLREGVVGARQRELALAAGYVVVWPGCRGRDNQAADGTCYGKAPAAIVDLKAAVRYVRHNRGVIPGDVDRIVSTGCSAGGALSTLLGASGNSPLYTGYLRDLGAAEAGDHIFAAGCFAPIIDLEHADMAYEWMHGSIPATRSGAPVDQDLSTRLRAAFTEYQKSLGLQGDGGFGQITAGNYDRYLLSRYLIPSAERYLSSLTDVRRDEYLAANPWVDWDGSSASFSWEDYLKHAGRFKNVPAFDDLEMKAPEPSLFGSETIEARHFTDFGLREATGDVAAEVDQGLRRLVDLMNPMYFLLRNESDCAPHWWLRRGTDETGIALTSLTNLDLLLRKRGEDVDTWLFWEARHCVDEDPEGFVSWIGRVARPAHEVGTSREGRAVAGIPVVPTGPR